MAKLFFTIILVLLLNPFHAFAQFTKVYLSIPTFPVPVSISAVDLKDGFKKIYVTDEKLVTLVARPSDADLEIHVTDSTYDATRVRFTFTFILHDSRTRLANPPIPIEFLLPTSLDYETTKERLALNAGKGVKLLQDIVSEEMKEGKIFTEYSDPNLNNTGPPAHENLASRLAKSPYYFQFSGNASGGIEGSGNYSNRSLNDGVSYDFSVLKNRSMADFNGSYSQSYESVPQPNADGSVTGNFTTSTSKTLSVGESAVYTLSSDPTHCKGCWGVVVLNSTVHAPASNIQFENNAELGMEWILYPFKQIQNKEITVKGGASFVVLNLQQANGLGQSDHDYFAVFGSIYSYWVLSKNRITATLSASGNYYPAYGAYSTCNGNFNVTLQATDALSFSFGGGINYMEKSLTYPANPNLSNSLQAQLLGGQAGISPSCSGSVNISFGNRNRKGIDKR